MRLEDLGREISGDGRDVRRLERAGRNDDLVGLEAPVVEGENEPALLGRQPSDGAVQLNGQAERGRVLLEVGDDVVARRVSVGIPRERQSCEGRVAPRREEDE